MRMYNVPPMVGSLFSWKSLLTKRRTRDDCNAQQTVWLAGDYEHEHEHTADDYKYDYATKV